MEDQVWAFVNDQRHSPQRRMGVGCPWPLALCHLAERFGVPPWELEDAPSDRLRYYARLMGIEGEARAAMEGLKPDEPFVRLGD